MKNDENATLGIAKKRATGSGWKKLKEPADLEKMLCTALNKCLMSHDVASHAGKIASLGNTWVNAHKLKLEVEEMKDFNVRLSKIEKQQAEGKNGK